MKMNIFSSIEYPSKSNVKQKVNSVDKAEKEEEERVIGTVFN